LNVYRSHLVLITILEGIDILLITMVTLFV